MKAVVISAPGGPEVLTWREVAEPQPGPREVLVRVRATALNRADLLQRRGRYPAPADAPADIPGLEFAGEVLYCGEAVRSLRPGGRVMGILGGGGYAERVAVHEELCLDVPPTIDWGEAAAIPEAFLTAFDALFEQGRLLEHDRVLVHAAGSGVGTAAAQLALAAGAQVVGLSRSESKRRRLGELGIRHVLDPELEQVADAVRQAVGGDGVDLVLCLVGASALAFNLDVLTTRGRLVLIGLLGGSRTEIDLARLVSGRLTLVGSVLRTRTLEEKIALTRAFAERVGPWIACGRVRAVIDRRLPLERAAEAHALMERNANFGKIVLLAEGDET